jgi:hypothetical protein
MAMSEESMEPDNNTKGRGRRENLTPFKPGQSGNPGGRPKKAPITDYLRDQLEAPIPEAMKAKLPPIFIEVYGTDATFGQMVAFKIIAQAAEGNMQAAGMLLDRTEGKVPQGVRLGGEDGGPVQFFVTRGWTGGRDEKNK